MGSSSSNSTRNGVAMGLNPGDHSVSIRGLVQNHPKKSELAHNFEESFEFDRLHHVGVHADVVALHDVLFFPGRSQHDDRNRPQHRVLLHGAQNLEAIHLRHLQVEQHQYRKVRVAAGEFSGAAQIIEASTPSRATTTPLARRWCSSAAKVSSISLGLSSTSRMRFVCTTAPGLS